MTLDRNFQQSVVATPSPQRSGEVLVSRRAEGARDQVGWGRFSVFYLPLVPVRVDGDVNEKVMETVVEALRIAGYEPSLNGSPGVARAPVVTCKVEQFWFNNYTWLWPWVPTWGDVRLRVSVERAGASRWSQTFSGSGRANGMVGGFSDAGNAALGQVMDQMARAFVSDDFYRAVGSGAEGFPARSAELRSDPETIGCTTEQVLAMKRNGVADDLIRRACQQEE